MSLLNQIRALQARTEAELVESHDYYTDTIVSWNTLANSIAKGESFTLKSDVTGTMTSEAELIRKTKLYAVNNLPRATFHEFLAIFEVFFFDFLRLWLTAYPNSLNSRQLDGKSILEAPDKEAIVQLLISKELHELQYGKVAVWFAFLESKAKLGCPQQDEIEQLAEAKASRDVLAHTRGRANTVYLEKSGKLARYKLDEPIDIPEPYHRRIWALLRKIVADMCDRAIGKLEA